MEGLSNGIRAVGAGEEMACIFCQKGICLRKDCKSKITVIRTFGEEMTVHDKMKIELEISQEQRQLLSESMGILKQKMDETLRSMNLLLEKKGLQSGGWSDEAETHAGGRTDLKQGFDGGSSPSMEMDLSKERNREMEKTISTWKENRNSILEEKKEAGQKKSNTVPPQHDDEDESLEVSETESEPKMAPHLPPSRPPPSMPPTSSSPQQLGFETESGWTMRPTLKQGESYEKVQKQTINPHERPSPLPPPLSSPPPPQWFKCGSERTTLNKGGSNQGVRKLEMLLSGSYRPPSSPSLPPPPSRSEFCASLPVGIGTRHQQSAVKITAPLNDGREQASLGFQQNGLNMESWAEIGSLGSEKLDLTNVTIMDVEKLSPNKIESMVAKPNTESAIYTPFPTYAPPQPTFKSNSSTETSLNQTRNTHNSLLHRYHLLSPRNAIQPPASIPLLPAIGDPSSGYNIILKNNGYSSKTSTTGTFLDAVGHKIKFSSSEGSKGKKSNDINSKKKPFIILIDDPPVTYGNFYYTRLQRADTADYTTRCRKELQMSFQSVGVCKEFNVINGIPHANNKLEMQEFMIFPVGASFFKEATKVRVEVYHNMKSMIMKKYGHDATKVGDEGGFAPNFPRNKENIDLLKTAIVKAGYMGKVVIGMVVAASKFYEDKGKTYGLNLEEEKYDESDYPMVTIEDPLVQDDREHYDKMTSESSKEVKIVGDYLIVSNHKRVEKAIKERTCNAHFLKVNQISLFTVNIEASIEMVKFGQLTICLKGNWSGCINAKLEEYVVNASDGGITFNVQPNMEALKLGEKAHEAIFSGRFDQVRVKRPKHDMVEHTDDVESTVLACKAADRAVKRILDAVSGTLLLCGTLGLGKTTLRHCGYRVVEINVSDDRSASTIETKILDAVQVNSIMADSRLKCLITDKLDGALGDGKGAVDVILKMVSANRRSDSGTESIVQTEQSEKASSTKKSKIIERIWKSRWGVLPTMKADSAMERILPIGNEMKATKKDANASKEKPDEQGRNWMLSAIFIHLEDKVKVWAVGIDKPWLLGLVGTARVFW